MSTKLFAALCVLGAVLLASQTVTCADDEQSDNQYIVDVDSDTPVIVTDPAGGGILDSAATRSCSSNQCNTRCRSQGFKKGECKSRRVCTCFNIAKLYTMDSDNPILNPYSIVPCVKSVCSASCKGKGQSYGECIATVSCNCS